MSQWHLRAAQPADWPALSAMLPVPPARLDPGALPSRQRLIVAGRRDAGGKVGPLLGVVELQHDIGMLAPRYWFYAGWVVRALPGQARLERQRSLRLGNDFCGASEIAALACNCAALDSVEQGEVLELLAQAAVLVLARDLAEGHAAAGPEARLIAEVPGPGEDSGAPSAAKPHAPDPTLVRGLTGALAAEGLRRGSHISLDEAHTVFESRLDMLRGLQFAQPLTLSVRALEAATRRWLVLRDGGLALDVVPAVVDHAIEPGRLMISAPWQKALQLADGEPVWARPMD